MTHASTDRVKHETVELPVGSVIHYSGLEGGVSFACGHEVRKGDLWSQYQKLVTCDKCRSLFDAQ